MRVLTKQVILYRIPMWAYGRVRRSGLEGIVSVHVGLYLG